MPEALRGEEGSDCQDPRARGSVSQSRRNHIGRQSGHSLREMADEGETNFARLKVRDVAQLDVRAEHCSEMRGGGLPLLQAFGSPVTPKFTEQNSVRAFVSAILELSVCSTK